MTFARIQARYVGRLGVEVGLFVAVDHLRRAGALTPEQEATYLDVDDWFNTHLPNPPFYDDGNAIGAVTWFRQPLRADMAERVDRLRAIIDAHGVEHDLVEHDAPGTVVYEDEFRIGVVPATRMAQTPMPEGLTLAPSTAGSKRALKYAHIESERRFLVRSLPEGVVRTTRIADRYVEGTRLRLREMTADDGTVVRKLGHKIRLDGGSERIAHTSLYLDDAEWELLAALPARTLRKVRHHVVRDGIELAVDEHEDGTLVAELDGGETHPADPPAWLEVIREVTTDEAWTGGGLAR